MNLDPSKHPTRQELDDKVAELSAALKKVRDENEGLRAFRAVSVALQKDNQALRAIAEAAEWYVECFEAWLWIADTRIELPEGLYEQELRLDESIASKHKAYKDLKALLEPDQPTAEDIEDVH